MTKSVTYARIVAFSLSAFALGCTQPSPSTVSKPEVQPAPQATGAGECPAMDGFFTAEDARGDQLIRQRATDAGTVFTIDGREYTVDGKLRRLLGESKTVYVATCESGSLKIGFKTPDGQVKETIKLSKLTEEGDFSLETVGADGKESRSVLMNALPIRQRPQHVVGECPKLADVYVAHDSKSFVVTETSVEGGIRFDGIGGANDALSPGIIVDGKTHHISDSLYSAVCSGGKILMQARLGESDFGDVKISREAGKLVLSKAALGGPAASIETLNYEPDHLANDAETDAKSHAADQCPTLAGSFTPTDSNATVLSTERNSGQPAIYKVSSIGPEPIVADGMKYNVSADGASYRAFCVSQELRIYLFEKGSATTRMTLAPRGSGVQFGLTIAGKTERILVSPMPTQKAQACEGSSAAPCE